MEKPTPVRHVQRKPKNFKKSKSKALRDRDRMAKYKNKKNLTILEKFYELKFEYGLYHLTPFSPEIETLYEEYVGKVTPISVLLASFLEENVVSNCDTDFTSSVVPSDFIVSCDDTDYTVAESNKHNYCFHSYLINYTDSILGRCDSCGYEVIECDCVKVIDFATIFDDSFFICQNQNQWSILPGEIASHADLKKDFRNLELSLNTSTFPRMYSTTKWPIKLRTSLGVCINFKETKDGGENFEHFSLLFGDKVPTDYEKYLEVLYLLDCKSRIKVFMNIPLLSKLFLQRYGPLKDCNVCNRTVESVKQETVFSKKILKLKYCYNRSAAILGMMNIEQFLYVLHLRKSLGPPKSYKYRKKRYRINSPVGERG